MALRIFSKRLLNNSSFCKNVGVTSSNSMSSKSPAPKKDSQVEKLDYEPTKEGYLIKYWPFAKTMLPADPRDPPIPVKDLKLPNVVDASTGEEKLMLLAFENGILDPYCNLPTSREGKGTFDNPIIVESFVPSRLVACVCEPEQTFHTYTWLYYGEKKRTNCCGHWMELKEAPRFWEKIPRDDLLEISFFRELEEDGLLDDYLAGKFEEVLAELLERGHVRHVAH